MFEGEGRGGRRWSGLELVNGREECIEAVAELACQCGGNSGGFRRRNRSAVHGAVPCVGQRVYHGFAEIRVHRQVPVATSEFRHRSPHGQRNYPGVRRIRAITPILIDLERRRVIDILPGRDGVALKKWLEEHPGVEVVTRDRWAAFAQAVREGAPAAKQVADRWHLLKNLRQAVERVLARFSPEITKVVQAPAPTEGAVTTRPSGEKQPTAPAPPEVVAPVPPPTARSPREQARQAKKQAREQRHRQVREMRDQGHSIRATARQLGLSRQVVIRYRRQGTCPDWKPGRKGPSQLDEFREPIAAWVGSGGRNAKELHRLLSEKGCKASYDAVRRYVNRQIGSTGKPGRRTGATKPPVPPVPSARKLSFRFICPPKEAKGQPPSEDASPGLLDRVRKSIPGLGAALDVASELVAMIRKEVTRPLSDWLTRAEASGVGELKTFAQGLREDEAAVTAALTDAWSNGPVEGQVNRLKFIKRSMYGRAGWRLLRARVRRKD